MEQSARAWCPITHDLSPSACFFLKEKVGKKNFSTLRSPGDYPGPRDGNGRIASRERPLFGEEALNRAIYSFSPPHPLTSEMGRA